MHWQHPEKGPMGYLGLSLILGTPVGSAGHVWYRRI